MDDEIMTINDSDADGQAIIPSITTPSGTGKDPAVYLYFGHTVIIHPHGLVTPEKIHMCQHGDNIEDADAFQDLSVGDSSLSLHLLYPPKDP
ncbi:unnamed protein product [Schistocephalus solidus]|uniref:Uncharacterized protein n=1 Tax=Schistocephalus solidus TaxID=70667 RepID=A0A183TF35_SCHSO|nr:unnamed protein product [Schistocephalus solidus]